jgi:glutaredoxin-dependent peroxiredoxin
MAITAGENAPTFSLYNTNKHLTELDKLRGKKVLLLFFPAAFTSTCTKELCAIRDDLSWYNNVNAEVFGISTDAVYTLIRYKADQNLNFELLSDFNKEVSALYGALYETFSFGMKGVSRRAAFVIDENGVVKYAEVLESAGDLPDFERVRAALSRVN